MCWQTWALLLLGAQMWQEPTRIGSTRSRAISGRGLRSGHAPFAGSNGAALGAIANVELPSPQPLVGDVGSEEVRYGERRPQRRHSMMPPR
jgi:hypothetical protein